MYKVFNLVKLYSDYEVSHREIIGTYASDKTARHAIDIIGRDGIKQSEHNPNYYEELGGDESCSTTYIIEELNIAHSVDKQAIEKHILSDENINYNKRRDRANDIDDMLRHLNYDVIITNGEAVVVEGYPYENYDIVSKITKLTLDNINDLGRFLLGIIERRAQAKDIA